MPAVAELLIHISAPSSKKDDDRYRNMAQAYADFQPMNAVQVDLRMDVMDNIPLLQTGSRDIAEIQEAQPSTTLVSPPAQAPSQYLHDSYHAAALLESQLLTSSLRGLGAGSQDENEVDYIVESHEENDSNRTSGASGRLDAQMEVLYREPSTELTTTQVEEPPALGIPSPVPAFDQEGPAQHTERPDMRRLNPGTQRVHSAVDASSSLPHPPLSTSRPSTAAVSISTRTTTSPPHKKLKLTQPNPFEPQPITTSPPSTSISTPPSTTPSYETIHPPPPLISEDPHTTFITPLLQSLISNPILIKRYQPLTQIRLLRPQERGYWRVAASVLETWDEELRSEMWKTLVECVGGNGAGWGVSVFLLGSGEVQEQEGDGRQPVETSGGAVNPDRAARVVREDANPVGRGDGDDAGIAISDGKQELVVPAGELRVYCFGEVVQSVYLLLYVASRSNVRGKGLCWVDASGEDVVRMP